MIHVVYAPENNGSQIDYLTIRVSDIETPYDVIREVLHLDPEDFTISPKGRYNYTGRMRLDNINVYFGGKAEMGICVELSGEGCRELEILTHDAMALYRVLTHPSVRNGSVTRIDLAFDDVEGLLDIDTMVHKADLGEIRSKSRRSREIRGMGEDHGRTLYLGSASSMFRVRIYDKAAEQGISGHWLRVEMQLRQERAQSFVDAYVREIESSGSITAEKRYDLLFSYGAGVLLEKAAFIEMTDGNKSRCPVCLWWSDFLSGAKPLDIRTDKMAPSVDRAATWIRKSVIPTLVTLLILLGPEWFLQVLEYGVAYLLGNKEKYKTLATAFIASGHTPTCPLSNDTYFSILDQLRAELNKEQYVALQKEAPASSPWPDETQGTT